MKNIIFATPLATLASVVLLATPAFAQAGTWTAMPMDSVTGLPHRNIVLLTNGTLLAQEENADGHVWTRLAPGPTGNYLDGTWSPGASTQIDRRYFPYAVLKDGRVFIAGGEIRETDDTSANAVEIYDPLLNAWSRGADGLFGDIGDVPNQVLADGRVMVGLRGGPMSQIYDPVTNQWTQTATRSNGPGAEETWSLLPGGAVLDWTPPNPSKYLPATNQWIDDAAPPITMRNPDDFEVGPGVFLYSGKLLAFSAFGRTALYTPAASQTAPGSWVAGPSVPPPAQPNNNPNGTQFTEDVAACIEVNGKVLLVSSDTALGAGRFDEYDPVTNTIAQIPGPPGVSPNRESFLFQMLALPNGQILLTGTNINDFVYTPVGGPQDVWRPTIQSITPNANGTFTLTGTKLNGLSQGASYGDEGNAQTNYPLVRLVNGSTVRYARTFDHSTMDFATGAALVQTHFALPANIPSGTYQVSAVANGIASTPVSLTVSNNQLSTSLNIYNQWATGYCTTVNVTNTLSHAITTWTVVLDLANATFNAHWQAEFTQNGSTLTAHNASNNGSLAPAAQAQFGFCTQAPEPVQGPTITSATGS